MARTTALDPLVTLDDLRDLVEHEGPFLTAYLASAPSDAGGVVRRWDRMRRVAHRVGAPEAELAAVDDAARQLAAADATRTGPGGVCVVVPVGGSVHVERLVRAPVEAVAWAACPALRPLVAARQRRQPHVVCVVDRRGGDLRARAALRIADVFVAPAGPVGHRVDERGAPWSVRVDPEGVHGRWPGTMAEVAREVAQLAALTAARVVAVGGEDDAVRALVDELPDPVRALVRTIDVHRDPTGPPVEADGPLDAVLQGWVAARLTGSVYRLTDHIGSGGRTGSVTLDAGESLAALRTGAVATLLVEEASHTRRPVWVGSTPDQIALDSAELIEPHEGRPADMLDAAVSAALAVGADVQVVPETVDLPDGLCALVAR
jgi:hypothetical protein